MKLTALLMSTGPSFEIHAMGCADIKKTIARGKVQNRFNFAADTEHDAVYEVYSDQIDESVGEGEDYRYHTEDEAIDGFASDVHFNGCCKLQWGHPATGSKAKATPAPADKAPAQANGATKLTREQKTRLATAVVKQASTVLGDTLVAQGMDPAEAARTVSQWLHHLPVDRSQWPADLPKPDRSDWR